MLLSASYKRNRISTQCSCPAAEQRWRAGKRKDHLCRLNGWTPYDIYTTEILLETVKKKFKKQIASNSGHLLRI